MALRTALYGMLVYGLYWAYIGCCPGWYNEASHHRWHLMRHSLQTPVAELHPSLLFIGDSRLNAGVEFAQIDSCFSMATGGVSPIEMYWMLRKYIDRGTKPRRVVVSQSPRFFAELFAFWGYAVRNDFVQAPELRQVLAHADSLHDSILGPYPWARYALYRARYFEYYQPDLRAARIVFGRRRNQQLAAYYRANRGKTPHPLHHRHSAELNYETRLSRFAPSALLQHYFDALLRLCAQEGIEVWVLHMPMNASSYQALHPAFVAQVQAYFEALAQRYPQFRVDTHLYPWPDAYFGDASHLHRQGAQHFTRYLQHELPRAFAPNTVDRD